MYWLVYSSLLRTASSWAIPRSWASTASRLSRLFVALASLIVQYQVGCRLARRSVHEQSSPSTDPSQDAPWRDARKLLADPGPSNGKDEMPSRVRRRR